MRLTRRGQYVAGFGFILSLLALMGFFGWVETLGL